MQLKLDSWVDPPEFILTIQPMETSKADKTKPSYEQLVKTIEELGRAVQALQADNAVLRKALHQSFKSTGSRFDNTPANQLTLFGDSAATLSVDQAEEELQDKKKKSKKRNSTGRQPLADGLRRVKEDNLVAETERYCSCCNPPKLRKSIRTDITEILEYTPSEFYVREIHSEVLACNSGMDTVVSAPRAPRLKKRAPRDKFNRAYPSSEVR